MTNIETVSDIDWMACELIEQVPGKVSGRPVVRGTRILPDPIVNSYDLGDTIEEIHEGFPTLSIAQIQRRDRTAGQGRCGPADERVADVVVPVTFGNYRNEQRPRP